MTGIWAEIWRLCLKRFELLLFIATAAADDHFNLVCSLKIFSECLISLIPHMPGHDHSLSHHTDSSISYRGNIWFFPIVIVHRLKLKPSFQNP